MNKRIVDFHAHPVTDEFRRSMDYLGINPIAEDGFPLPKWSVDEHLDFMKNAGIDYTVLSVPAPHIHNGDDRKSRNAARKINLPVAEICKAHSDKFGFAACVPLPDTEGAVAVTAYAMDELGAVGVNQTEDKYMKTKIALLLTIIVFILSLAACSGNTDRQTSQSQPDTSVARNQPDETQGTAAEPDTKAGKTLVVYFSATGTTKGVAEKIAKVTNADIYEIRAAQAYTDADLNWHDSSSRTTKEQNDKSIRPEIASEKLPLDGYTTVYIGYPIWWGEEPRIMDTFAESYDFDGITMIPFCTSGGSGIGRSGKNLEENAGSGTWLDGERLSSSISEAELQSWIDSLQ